MAKQIVVALLSQLRITMIGRNNRPKQVGGIAFWRHMEGVYNKLARLESNCQNIKDMIMAWLEEVDDLINGFDGGNDVTKLVPKRFTVASAGDKFGGIRLNATELAQIDAQYAPELEEVKQIAHYQVPHSRPFELKEEMQKNTPWSMDRFQDQYSEQRQFLNATEPQGTNCDKVRHVVNKYAEITNDISDMVEDYSADKAEFETDKQSFLVGLKAVEKQIETELKTRKYTKAEEKDLKYWTNYAKQGTNQWITEKEHQFATKNKNALHKYKTNEVSGTLRSTINRYHADDGKETDLKKYINYLAHTGSSAMKRTTGQSDMKTYGNLDIAAKHLAIITSPRMTVEASQHHLVQLKSTINSLRQKTNSCSML